MLHRPDFTGVRCLCRQDSAVKQKTPASRIPCSVLKPPIIEWLWSVFCCECGAGLADEFFAEGVGVDLSPIAFEGGEQVEGGEGETDDGKQGEGNEGEPSHGGNAQNDTGDVNEPEGDREVACVTGVDGDEGIFWAVAVDEPEEDGAEKGQDSGGDQHAEDCGEVGQRCHEFSVFGKLVTVGINRCEFWFFGTPVGSTLATTGGVGAVGYG